ncbi:MAG: glycoside hydrolase family 2 protein [Ruminococcaceae bacterium]|nr:glycoside hydrolase family 2 protein [Oscillospiraceae bacterium]
MRTTLQLNSGWAFSKRATEPPTDLPTAWEAVTLPHTYNAKDGQDGGNDYHRGVCYYARQLKKSELPQAARYYLEIRGANSSADVLLDGKQLCHHDGGYSTWRVDLTKDLREESLLVIAVDNSPNDRVYPQMADFTFYGGLYRDVRLVCVEDCHFDLLLDGGEGIRLAPTVSNGRAEVSIEASVCGMREDAQLRYCIVDASGVTVATHTGKETAAILTVEQPHLWQGKQDPYLYRATVELILYGDVLDRVSLRFGCRSFHIDPDRGFFLNGKHYPLRGVSRHQDRLGIGNALLPHHHLEDIDLICELGATTVRLAHYQHDQYFYDLCDERGLVVWAEIPYISRHMPKGRENTLSQMRELIVQNHHHPSIIIWGLSNEITMGGDKDSDLLENHRLLNDLCHQLDPTRLTAVAAVSPCPIDSPYLQIPDVVSYNHYFGWYGGNTAMNGPWFDRFHARHPQIPIGCSEYGCEALDWHTSHPVQGDYTEEYQAHYHEELIRQLFEREYLFATHVWNMFDFGADARNEGGENGQNHKGLVTMDRRYRKDAFYAYKAWLSDRPFVHLCGKRYVDRTEPITRVTVYSNLPEVELLANGKSLGKKSAPDHFFYFDVPNEGETELVAVAGELRDVGRLRRVEQFNERYRLREQGAVLNWFDVTEREGYFSLNDPIGEIMRTPKGAALMETFLRTLLPPQGEGQSGGFEMNEGMQQMMQGFTPLRLARTVGAMGRTPTKEELLSLGELLNSIKKPDTV